MPAFNSIRKLGRGREGGFSLVEVLIAMSILSVGLMALAQMQIVAMRFNRQNAQRAEAENVAQEQMETVINTTWAPPAGPPGANVLALDGTQDVTRNGNTYHVTTSVPGPVVNNTLNVTVQVTYNDGVARTITLQTTKSQAEDPQ